MKTMAQAFFGGVHPHDMKAATNEKAIEQLAPPAVVVIPMSMHFGAPCTPLVKAGAKCCGGRAGILADPPGAGSLSAGPLRRQILTGSAQVCPGFP